LEQVVEVWIEAERVQRLLLVPPDHTRLASQAGTITEWLWHRLNGSVQVDIMPALGTHQPMSPNECVLMFGDVPFESIVPHRWREELEQLGEISRDEMSQLSNGRFNEPMRVELNRRIVSGEYDLILSIGQVVPHEVIGFANYTKNVCIGTGGKDIIHKSHFLGAACDMETIMGRVDTPVRAVIDAAFDRYVRPRANVKFLLSVVEETGGEAILRGLFAGTDRNCYTQAADLSSQVNITVLDEPIDRCIVYLDPREFSSTWLGNKSIYRTRMAMADGGELIVLAPAVRTFGEDATIDRLIRRHGYRGTPSTRAAIDSDPDLQNNLSAAAHLIHGSSEGRFSITYCVPDEMKRDEIEGVGFSYRRFANAASEFPIESLQDGWQETDNGQRFYFIRNPALGLWTTRDRFAR
jgi:nickel-dependent lactate racemase